MAGSEAVLTQTSAAELYRVIVEAVRTLDEFMATEGLGIFLVPELPVAFAAWQGVIKHKAKLFGDRKLDSSWEAKWDPIERVDMKLTAGDETMLFEFKVRARTDDYICDLNKLARSPAEPTARLFLRIGR